MDDTVRDYDYIEELNGHDDHDGDHDGGSTNSSGPVSTDIDLSSRLAAVSSKPQRRQRPGNHSIPQKSKSAGLPTSRVTTAATTTATSTGLVTPGRLPRRNKSGDLPPSRATHNAHTTHRELSSKSAHAVSEDWFDFDSGPIPKHSTTSISTQSHSSNDDNSGELEESSFHGEENNRRSVRLRERREIVRTMSGKRERERVHEGGEALPGTALATTTSTSTSAATPAPPPPPPRGLARTKSGVPRPPQNQTPPSRVPPTRSRSDALMSSRRESMKALYRSNQDELTSTSRSISSTSKIVSEGESNSGTPRPRPRPQRAASGLEAGALSAVMMDRRPPTRSRSSDSTQLLTPIDDTNENSDQEQSKPQDAKWLERRQNKQDEIMTLAHDVKERFADAREKQEDLDYAASREIGTASSGDNFGNFNDDDDDDDQPMAMRTKKTVLEQLKKVANKTGAGARSLGKGTVNAIHDPKLAAKRLGHLSKDVGKATIKTALDPSKLAKGAKNMTVSNHGRVDSSHVESG